MKKIESGRSMIEMLGVLAIIGVLSIGGLAAYNSAMDRNDANNILDFGSKLGMYATEKEAAGATCATIADGTVYGMDVPDTIDVGAPADCVYTITVKSPDVYDVVANRLKAINATINSAIPNVNWAEEEETE